MNNDFISEIIDGKDEAKPYMEDQLIWRQVKSRGEKKRKYG